MYNEKMKDKSTLTYLFGLNKTIEKREDDDKLPMFPKEVQATPEVRSSDCQTDLEVPTNIEELL